MITTPEQVGRTKAPVTRDYFAEMYIAGLLADAGWNVYFPKRDDGFDMIISRRTPDGSVVRPVQVKGKYATDNKTDKGKYGYIGKLTTTHPDMLLAIPYFTSFDASAPCLIAWVPFKHIKVTSKGHSFEPAFFKNGKPEVRRDFAGFFGDHGLQKMSDPTSP